MFLVTSFLTLIFALWMVARIWKSSAIMAIISFFFFPAAIIPLIQNWGDEENDIKVPFFLTLIAWAYTIYSMMSYAKESREETDALLAILQMLA